MNNVSGAVVHTFASGQWSNLGSRRVTLGSKTSCKVELRYTAS